MTHRILVFFRGRLIRELVSQKTTADEFLSVSTGTSEGLSHVG